MSSLRENDGTKLEILSPLRQGIDVKEMEPAKELGNMKKVLLLLSVVFILLTFAGAVCVLASGGSVNVGYGAVPLVIALACLSGCRAWGNKRERD